MALDHDLRLCRSCEIYIIRFFPCAVAVLWPVFRLMPAELSDAVQRGRRDAGAGICAIVVWPMLSAVFCGRGAGRFRARLWVKSVRVSSSPRRGCQVTQRNIFTQRPAPRRHQ